MPSGSNYSNIEDLPGVVQLNDDQVKQLFRPLGTLIYTEDQTKKLLNDSVVTNEDVEAERQLRNKNQEKKVIV